MKVENKGRLIDERTEQCLRLGLDFMNILSLIIKSAQDEESQCLSLYPVQIHTSKQLQGM